MAALLSSDSLVIRGARVALDAAHAELLDLEIRDGRIDALRPAAAGRGSQIIDLSGRFILPGLINAHDHLEFNLFPRLGNGPYPNAGAWAQDIYHPDAPPVREHLTVPKPSRLIWGGLKNLLSGVTCVCHHNPVDDHVFDESYPVRVLKRFGWAHSLEFCPDLAGRSGQTPAGWPFILHLGEATDEAGTQEIHHLAQAGALDSRTVLIHAVALDRAGFELARARGASIVWCPSSNIFVLGRTVAGFVLQSSVAVALGSDSALTGCGDLLDELRFARQTGSVPDESLYGMVTKHAARVLRLPPGSGVITEGGYADLMALPGRASTPAAALLDAWRTGPELVMVGGQVRLISEALDFHPPGVFHRLHLEGRQPVRVRADLPDLLQATTTALGGNLRLAGKRVLS
ncbi:MAG TPA: amidohydrolase family protein [Bryobacteraceae bacterium]|nr:amidohydrolase family protein [Bryobacteraceae bacterium]